MNPFLHARSCVTLLAILAAIPVQAALTIPGATGADGAFAPTGTNVIVDLSLAPSRAWDSAPPSAGRGVYDSEKWAVVFKYTSVNIPAGCTVSFKNHASRAPVVWLVSGDVTIEGAVDLSGKNVGIGPEALIPAEGGPGGFRSGAAGPEGTGWGLGWGGAWYAGTHGAYAILYGNPQIIPLIGGSGSLARDSSGGGGGGAILIAVTGRVQINGVVLTHGGGKGGSFGAAGAVRIIANEIAGSGEIDCLTPGHALGYGRIRLETPSLASSLRTYPETIAVSPATPPLLWPPANAPKARIVSVDGVNAPSEPTAPLQSSADLGIANDQKVNIVVETRDFPVEGKVEVRVGPKFGVAGRWNAELVNGNQTLATWKATVTFPKGFSTVQARATAP